MTEELVPTANPVPWPLSQPGRVLLSAMGGGIAALTASALPHETRVILGLDVFLVILVALTYLMMSVMTADQCAVMAKLRTPIRHTGVIASIVATLVGVGAIGVMLHSQRGEAHWLRTFHLGGSLVALLFGWIAAQMTFAIQYMRVYYRNLDTRSSSTPAAPGLDFPGQTAPDLWDFMYYSFTIAMCFQTSDVSISGTALRRLTLMHAVYSFFFVAAIIGFVVNVLSNLA